MVDKWPKNPKLLSPTPENNRFRQTPWVHWKHDWEEFGWPFYKVGYKNPDALFQSLHAEFNSFPIAISDPHAWHADVCEAVRSSDNQAEFHAALRRRRDERFKEMNAAWNGMIMKLGGRPYLWESSDLDPTQLWGSFTAIARHFSFDTFIDHFGSYLPPKDPASATQPQPTNARQQAALPPNPTPDPPPDAEPMPSERQTVDLLRRSPRRTKKPSTQSGRIEKAPATRRRKGQAPRQGVRRSARLQEKGKV
ncbi:hypothetical protein F5Y18DRAFT_245453 [Xylariaceae sp. FL1019]|nr:hypothetical protein F5Y18DRAFT_245453 [Xylariaceae sp. FL1019]